MNLNSHDEGALSGLGKTVLGTLVAFVLSSCLSQSTYQALVWLAWGDSYTIGEGVAVHERWPEQVAAQDTQRWQIEYTARTGWTSSDLLKALASKNYPPASANRISLLIGVNNQYRGLSPDDFRHDFIQLLTLAIQTSRTGSQGVLVLTIPDYGVTPFGQRLPGTTINLAQFNSVIEEGCQKHGIQVVDITPLSLRAATEPNLTARDGLHPSGEQYRLWAEMVRVQLK